MGRVKGMNYLSMRTIYVILVLNNSSFQQIINVLFTNWIGFSYYLGQILIWSIQNAEYGSIFIDKVISISSLKNYLIVRIYQYSDAICRKQIRFFLHLSLLYKFRIHISNSLTEESIAAKRLFKNKNSRSALYTQFTVEIDRLHLYMLWRLAPHSRRAANWRHNTHTFTPPTKFLISKIYTELIALLVARKLCIQSCKKNL